MSTLHSELKCINTGTGQTNRKLSGKAKTLKKQYPNEKSNPSKDTNKWQARYSIIWINLKRLKNKIKTNIIFLVYIFHVQCPLLFFSFVKYMPIYMIKLDCPYSDLLLSFHKTLCKNTLRSISFQWISTKRCRYLVHWKIWKIFLLSRSNIKLTGRNTELCVLLV